MSSTAFESVRPEDVPADVVRAAARRFLNTPGDQPGPDDTPGEQEWAEHMMSHAIAEVYNQIWGIGYAAAYRDITGAQR